MSEFENERSNRSAATLICDYSANDLNALLMQSNEANDEMTQLNSLHTSPGKQSSADKYNQLTKLDDEEENVDFLHLFNQYQQATGYQKPQNQPNYEAQQQPSDNAQVQYYQPQQMMNESYSERLNQSYTNQQQQMQQNLVPDGVAVQGAKNQRAMRPGSATVAGQQARFANNQQGKRKHGPANGSVNQLDQYSYSYQQPAPLMNNLMGPGIGMKQISGQLTSQGSQHPAQFGQQLSKPPLGLGRKRTRPQSAAKNQMHPAKELQSVTNFTYQKAKQNLNQKAYVPDSLKNTDKERLYEEKINLKKQLNEQIKTNQQLKTQIQNQQGLIRKKDDTVRSLMKQMFHSEKDQGKSMDNFLQEFQKREILHNHEPGDNQAIATVLKSKSSNNKSVKSQNVMVNKESQITSLKLKMKELNEVLMFKERELLDLKQTLKFTKIKEYESELALNVQESQRLRALLEREIRKPKIDPRFVQGLKQQIAKYQQIILHLQQNQSIQQENYDKLNKKLILQIKKQAKQKDARKRLQEKNQRLEKKVAILQSKVVAQGPAPLTKGNSKQQNANLQYLEMQWKQRFDEQQKQQANLIEKLLLKMQDCGIEINEEELLDMQLDQGDDFVEQQQQRSDQFGVDELEQDDKNIWDIVADYGGAVSENGEKNQHVRKQINGVTFENLDHLTAFMRKQFAIDDQDQIKIKYVTEEGELNELLEETWDHLRELAINNQIQLGIELVKQESAGEASNYEDDDDFEEIEIEKQTADPIQEKQVKQLFKELRIILQIKNIKRGDSLKYILHGERNPETNKKVTKVSIDVFNKQLQSKIGLDKEVSLLLAKYLIEKPNEDGKIELLGDKTQTHEQACTIIRKELHEKFMKNLDEYVLYNGLAITSLLGRLQGLFEEGREEFVDELEGRDYDDLGTATMESIHESMGLVGVRPSQIDEELTDFMNFLAMRHSKNLNEVVYKDFCAALDPDYSYLEDKKSIWDKDSSPSGGDYEPSSDEGELESERSPPKSETKINEAAQQEDQENFGVIDDLEQNVLLEKVDEILMQIVQRLPQHHKIRTLTQYMIPYLNQVFDPDQQRQYLVISQDNFVQFLLGQGQNQLGLQLQENHIICLLHLLVREEDDKDDQDSQNKYILYDEFVELVKTYMKKELIMNQSKDLGINYDILSKQSVEFLFQIRSSLMHDSQNINENSADEDEYINGSSQKKNKSVPSHIREIFKRIIQKKSIQLKNNSSKSSSKVEVMDFDLMLDVLFMRMGIQCPSGKSQEELKYLMCLDFKYLEMVMLVKFDKVMHDLDYISIDLLRQAQDPSMDSKRKKTLDKLKKIRDEQLSILKAMQDKASALKHKQQLVKSEQADIYGGQPDGAYEFNGVSQSSKQEKKRKRPDDKKQTLSKKLGSNNNVQFGNNKDSQQKLDQDHQYAESSANNTPGQKGRYGAANQDQLGNRQIKHEAVHQDRQEGVYPGAEDYDNIDVDLDVDINHKDKNKGAISDDFEEDYLQDDIPIDDDDDEDGIISDNYENLEKTQTKSNIVSSPTNQEQAIKKNDIDEHVISMDHSDDIDQSNKHGGFVLPSDSPQQVKQIQDEDDVDEDEFENDEDMGLDDDEDQIDDQYDDDEIEDDAQIDIAGMDPEELEAAIQQMQQDLADDSQPMSSERIALEESMPQPPEQEKIEKSITYESEKVSQSKSKSHHSLHQSAEHPQLQQMISGRSQHSGLKDQYSEQINEQSEKQTPQSHKSSSKYSAIPSQKSQKMFNQDSIRKSFQSVKKSIQKSNQSLQKSHQSLQKSLQSSIRSYKDEVQNGSHQSEQYQDDFDQQPSQESETLQQPKQVPDRYSKNPSSHSSRKQSVKSMTESNKASQRVSEKASQRYKFTHSSQDEQVVKQDIQQQRASLSNSLDKQERSPVNQKPESENEIEDFDVDVPSAQGSTQQYAANQQQDQASEQYEENYEDDEEYESSHKSGKALAHSNNQPFDESPANNNGSSQKLMHLDDKKSSVQQVEEDQYIQDDFDDSDEYEDDINDLNQKSGQHSQIDQAKEPSKQIIKTTSKNQFHQGGESDAELEDDYEF